MRSVVKIGLVIAGLSVFAVGRADILLDWERTYHVAAAEESFASVAIDDVGNVYAIGKTYNGSNYDALVVKYGAGGGLHWAVKYTGAGDQLGQSIAVKPDGSELYVGFLSKPARAWLRRLNPASGVTVWEKWTDAVAGRTFDDGSVSYDPANGHIHWGLIQWQAGVANALNHRTYDNGGAMLNVHGTGLPLGSRIFDYAVRPGGGAYYLVGDRSVFPPGSKVIAYDGNGSSLPFLSVDYATAIGTSNAKGGLLSCAGRYSPTQMVVTSVYVPTFSPVAFFDTFTGLTDLDVLDVVVGPEGETYCLGSESVPGKGTEWFMSRYAWSTNIRTWRTSRPNTVNNEFFRRGVIDQFGNIGVLGVRAGATDQLFTKVFDGATGALLGQSTTNSPSGSGNLWGIAANTSGVFGGAGLVQDVGFTKGLLTKVSQNGLRKLTVPLGSYVGGVNASCTVSMYASTGAIRTLNVSSNSPTYASTPASVQIAPNSTNTSFNIGTVPTAVDRTIVISAVWQGVTRSASFYLLAPRPSSLDISPASVVGGNSSTGTVHMTGNAAVGGVVVTLSSNGPEVLVPPSVTVPVSGNQQSFSVNSTPVVATVTRTVSAGANGVTKTDTLTVNP